MASTAKSRARVVTRKSTGASLKPSPAVCRACNNMPMRSGEILSLMLVLVFSLSAVLFTTVAAYNVEKAKVAELQAQLAVQP